MLLQNEPMFFKKRLPLWVGGVVAAILVAAMVWLRLVVAGRFILPIGYGVPLIIIAIFRSRRLLWFASAAFLIIIFLKFLVILPAESPARYETVAFSNSVTAAGLVLADLLLVVGMAHVWISIQERTQRQNELLEAANAELVTREEEIARSNEELLSQTEELERQSEELRVANDDLASRERMLQSLLDLSLALTTEKSRAETMTRICQTLAELVDGPSAAAAILEQEGDKLVVRCHHGFGPAGVVAETIPLEKSFAALILSRGRTGYLEDIELRPDLLLPRPEEGPAMRSVLAVPLRIRGAPIGTLEVYSRQKTAWNSQQVALAESLAAQTSVSLEAAGLFEDVSEERQRIETVLRTMPFAVVVSDAHCQDVRLNPAGAALFSATPDVNVATILRDWTFVRNGRPMPADQFPVIRACREGVDVVAEELEWIGPGGRRVMLLGNARPIRDGSGEILGAVAAFVDITPQKELQREIDLRRREAEEASVRKTRFLAAVSHDIRTPANAISLLAELVRRTASNPALADQVPELAGELHGSAISLVNLLSDVLDLARFDSGKVEMQESEFLLADLLEEEHRQMLPLAREKLLELQWTAPPEPIRIRTDRIKLARVLGNLIGNAIKFTEHGSVSVSVAPLNGAGVKISIADTGIGIPPDSQRHIFDEFVQLRNPERDRTKGTGLGLTICKRLIDAMGGRLEVSSAPQIGSTFTVTLPGSCVVA